MAAVRGMTSEFVIIETSLIKNRIREAPPRGTPVASLVGGDLCLAHHRFSYLYQISDVNKIDEASCLISMLRGEAEPFFFLPSLQISTVMKALEKATEEPSQLEYRATHANRGITKFSTRGSQPTRVFWEGILTAEIPTARNRDRGASLRETAKRSAISPSVVSIREKVLDNILPSI